MIMIISTNKSNQKKELPWATPGAWPLGTEGCRPVQNRYSSPICLPCFVSPGEHNAQQQRAKARAPLRLKPREKKTSSLLLGSLSSSCWVRIPSWDNFRVGDSWHADQLGSRPRLHCCDWQWRTQLLRKLLNEEVGRKPGIRIRRDHARDDGTLS